MNKNLLDKKRLRSNNSCMSVRKSRKNKKRRIKFKKQVLGNWIQTILKTHSNFNKNFQIKMMMKLIMMLMMMMTIKRVDSQYLRSLKFKRQLMS